MPNEPLTSNTHNTLEVGHIADLWHAGTERFYRARVIAAIASQEATAPFGDVNSSLKPSSIIERLERYKGCCTEASEAHQILTEAISVISALRRNDEVHWKTRRTLLRELAVLKSEEGPGEEDGPWAEGWEARRGGFETFVRYIGGCSACDAPPLDAKILHRPGCAALNSDRFSAPPAAADFSPEPSKEGLASATAGAVSIPDAVETFVRPPQTVAEDFWEKHWFAIGDCVRVVSQNCDLHDIVRRGEWLQQELSQRGFQLIVAEPPAEKANDEPPTCRICDRFTGHESGLCDACRS